MAFSICAILLFSALILSIATSRSLRERTAYYFLFLLYLGLLSHRLTGAGVPRWLDYLNFLLFAAGAVGFLSTSLRQSFAAGHARRRAIKALRKQGGPLYELVLASRLLSGARLGALIVIERHQSLETWANKGSSVDAALAHDLLFAIFTPPGALHDGATIVRNNRIASSGVIVPLTRDTQFPKELGTRHRAAVGFTEVSDGVCLVVSEESGAVSLADRGSLYYDIPLDDLHELLAQALRFELHKAKALRQARRREAKVGAPHNSFKVARHLEESLP